MTYNVFGGMLNLAQSIKQHMPFVVSCWKLNKHFLTVQPFSVCEVFISSRSSTFRGVLFRCMVTSLIGMHSILAVNKEYVTN